MEFSGIFWNILDPHLVESTYVEPVDMEPTKRLTVYSISTIQIQQM